MDQLPDTFWTAVKMVGGVALFILGISFAWKFFQAAMSGKLTYWAGLEKFGFLFTPLTHFISPLICHLPYNPNKSLIQVNQSLWVHLVFGPIFFVLALMCMTSGADLIGLPGSSSLNTVLTLGRSDVPPCILYYPPFNYKFPFVKKATKTVLKFVCTTIPTDKKNSYNSFEQNGSDVSHYTKTGIPWIDDDDDKPTETPANAAAATASATQPAAAPAQATARMKTGSGKRK